MRLVTERMKIIPHIVKSDCTTCNKQEQHIFTYVMLVCWQSLYNGNWNEWTAISSEIIHVILKIERGTAQVRFDITNMISDQKCTTQNLITTSFHPLWNRRIQSAPIFHTSSSWFVEKQKQRGFYNIHFVFKTEMMWDRAKMVWFSQNRNDAIYNINDD